MEPLHFTALYEAHAGDVLRYTTFLTGRADVAEEILAETFYRAWLARDTLQMATARGYLIAIARNLVTDRRRLARHPHVEIDPTHGSVAPRADTRLWLDQTIAALHTLEEKYREPLALAVFAELPYDEIARCLAMPVGTVKVRIHRARQLLLELMNPENPHATSR